MDFLKVFFMEFFRNYSNFFFKISQWKFFQVLLQEFLVKILNGFLQKFLRVFHVAIAPAVPSFGFFFGDSCRNYQGLFFRSYSKNCTKNIGRILRRTPKWISKEILGELSLGINKFLVIPFLKNPEKSWSNFWSHLWKMSWMTVLENTWKTH